MLNIFFKTYSEFKLDHTGRDQMHGFEGKSRAFPNNLYVRLS